MNNAQIFAFIALPLSIAVVAWIIAAVVRHADKK